MIFLTLLLLRAGFYSCDQYHRWPIDLLEKNEKFDKYKIFNQKWSKRVIDKITIGITVEII